MTAGARAAKIVADLQFRCRAAKVHALGPRAVCELLAQVAVEADAIDIVDEALDDYCRLDLEVLRIAGGHRMPALSTREVA